MSIVRTSKAVNAIFEERERARQDDFDMTNTKNDWVAYVNAYTGRAADKVRRNKREDQNFRANMIKAGGLIIAALEAQEKGWC